MIAADKANHFILGQIVAVMCLVFLGSVMFATMGVMGVAVGKEIYDSLGYGTVELADILYTLAGGLVPILLVLFF